LLAVKGLVDNFETQFISNLETLKNEVKFLKKIELTSDGLELDYGDITITHGAKEYYIGNMIAVIKPDKILFKNTKPTTVRGSALHPHVRNYGDACFGSFTRDIETLLATFDFKKLAILLRQFLNSYNPKSPIQSIDAWNATPKREKNSLTSEQVKEVAKENVGNVQALAELANAEVRRPIAIESPVSTAVINAARRTLTEAQKQMITQRMTRRRINQ
jgi:ubiquitin-protein ligase